MGNAIQKLHRGMSMKVDPELELQLEKLKISLIMKPETMFYTTIVFSLVFKWDTTIRTAAVDGKHMFFNPDFFRKLTPEERIGVFVHEVLHVALYHITRSLGHEPKISNYAADYVVNLIILGAGFILPPGCLYDNRFVDMSYEQVYKILMEEKKDGISFSDVIPGTGSDILPPADQAEASQVESDIAEMVLRATVQAQQIGMYGHIPGSVLVALDKTLNPMLPWDVIFQNYMNQFAKDDYSFRKPNKKYLPDLIMPSAYSEAVCEVVLAVDTSGSVSDKEFGFFIQEVEVIQQYLNPELITLIDFDTKIHRVHEITQNVNVLHDIKFTGRGGTDVHPILQWACENEPEIMIIFTDGGFKKPTPDKYPECPVLWLIHNNPGFTSQRGEVIHYRL